MGCRTGEYRNVGMQERRDARKEGCRKAGVQESMAAEMRDANLVLKLH